MSIEEVVKKIEDLGLHIEVRGGHTILKPFNGFIEKSLVIVREGCPVSITTERQTYDHRYVYVNGAKMYSGTNWSAVYEALGEYFLYGIGNPEVDETHAFGTYESVTSDLSNSEQLKYRLLEEIEKTFDNYTFGKPLSKFDMDERHSVVCRGIGSPFEYNDHMFRTKVYLTHDGVNAIIHDIDIYMV